MSAFIAPGIISVEVDMGHFKITAPEPEIQHGKTRVSHIRILVIWLMGLLAILGGFTGALVHSSPLDPHPQNKDKGGIPAGLPAIQPAPPQVKKPAPPAPAPSSSAPGEGKVIKERKPINPNEVEVRLSDGSRVHMLILQGSLEIETKYGKLVTPTSDLRRLEFGIRTPAEVTKKIEEAIKKLGNDSYQEREKAVKELVAVGAPAYVPLYQAAKTKDAEVLRRANQALEEIRKKVPESKLRVREDDLIQTADFTIIGKILNPTIKAKSAIFGETQLNIADLRGIRWMGQQAEVELTIDAAKYAVNASQWMETGIELGESDELLITASGQVDLLVNGQNVTGAAGNAQWGQGPGTNHPPGALLGKVGQSGQTFLIGESFKGMAKGEGKLFLQISPSPWARHGNAVSGSYTVKITGGRDTQER